MTKIFQFKLNTNIFADRSRKIFFLS